MREICREHSNDRTRLMDVALEVQQRFGWISGESIDLIAVGLNTSRVEVESLVSFYSFLTQEPAGPIVIRLCNDIIDQFGGAGRVLEVFEKELGIRVGETTPDGRISLVQTACIGMSDQAPAALINDVVVTRLSTDRAREIAVELKHNGDPRRLVRKFGDGNNAHELVSAMVENNIRMRGPVIFAPYEAGEALEKALAMSPAEVIRNVKTARLRGRGGAGFPTGMKWEYTRSVTADRRFIVCNADEGEPGTFKDRVILTECPDLLFEGMTIGAYAIGAREGILYLRAEYAYLKEFLDSVLEGRRSRGMLGEQVWGRNDFSFDIRIQMGAGAYVCGEETALLDSCEGKRGDPRNRPPFPAQKGYLGYPTSVTNVETFCCVSRIIQEGAAWFAKLGSEGSSGTKLLSISGDCRCPGIYEVPFGVSLAEVLRMAGAENAQAVQVGGPSGQMVGPADYGRRICFDDLMTGGSIMVFSPERDLLEVVDGFLAFFEEEGCGYCTPCRVGNSLMRQCLNRFRQSRAETSDLDYLEKLAGTVKMGSRCGLGQTSPNPVLSTLGRFRAIYEARVTGSQDGIRVDFDLAEAVTEAAGIAGRSSVHVER